MIELQMFNKPLPPHYCKTLVSGSAVINADCFDIFPYIKDKSVNLIFADLPYGTTQNKWDSVLSLDLLWKQYERIIADNGCIVLTADGIFTGALIMSNPKWFKYKLIWDKKSTSGFLNAKKMPLRRHEDILIFAKGKIQMFIQLGKPTTIGYLKKLISEYSDDTSFCFINMPLCELIETNDGDRKYVSFQYPKDEVMSYSQEKPCNTNPH